MSYEDLLRRLIKLIDEVCESGCVVSHCARIKEVIRSGERHIQSPGSLASSIYLNIILTILEQMIDEAYREGCIYEAELLKEARLLAKALTGLQSVLKESNCGKKVEL